MGITAIYETKTGRSGSWSVSGGRTYSVELRVEVDDVDTGPRAVILALGLSQATWYRYPITRTATEYDYGSFLNAVEVGDADEDGLGYKITLNFAPFDAQNEGAGGKNDPLNPDAASQWIDIPWQAPPTLRWSSEEIEFAHTHDRNGQPILNKAGDPFVPPIVTAETVPVAVVSRVEKVFNPNWIYQYKNTTNNAAWLGFARGTVLVKDIAAERTYDADWGWLWQVSYSFAFRPKTTTVDDKPIRAGWAFNVLNAGMRAWQSVAGGGEELVEITDSKGDTASEPMPLDADGKLLDTSVDDPIYITFDVYPETDFEDFNVPVDLFTASM